jgi:hypothetical protein
VLPRIARHAGQDGASTYTARGRQQLVATRQPARTSCLARPVGDVVRAVPGEMPLIDHIFRTTRGTGLVVLGLDYDRDPKAAVPSVIFLQGGMYQCKTCVPPININANGRDQKVSGDPYRDTISIKVVDDRTIQEIEKRNGKMVNTARTTVSVDGNTLTIEFTHSSDANANPVAGKVEATRVEKGPTGSHGISGSWKTTKVDKTPWPWMNMSDNRLLVTFKIEGDNLTMTTPTGQSYTAKLDGTEAPFKGHPGTTSVLVKGLANNRLEEIDKRGEK